MINDVAWKQWKDSSCYIVRQDVEAMHQRTTRSEFVG